ncbi:MAG: P63C domain-containing protein [Methylococcaceae bacterium]
MIEENKAKARGGLARAKSLTPEQRKEISSKAISARWEKAELPKVLLKKDDLNIVGLSIPCAIIGSDNDKEVRRVLTEGGIHAAILGDPSGASKRIKRKLRDEGIPIPLFLAPSQLKSFINNDLMEGLLRPIEYTDGNKIITGYDARILPIVCDIWLKAREAGALQKQQLDKAQKAEILMRGLAHVGIIALVDEATGYQSVRAKNALAEILEAFVAKELQPYIKTFPADYYEQLFRIYNLPYPPLGNKSWRPSFFGKITNDVIYDRLAPDLLPELKKAANKAEKKSKLFQWLTNDIGHPKLREHLASIVTILKLSRNPQEFKQNVDRIHTRYGNTFQVPFDYPSED